MQSVIDISLVGLWVLGTWHTYRHVADDSRISHDAESGFNQLASALLTSRFGSSYWTLRGLGCTFVLCWGHGLIRVLATGDLQIFGSSGYPVYEFLILSVMLVLPLWVHVVVHAIRKYLDLMKTRYLNAHLVYSACMLPLVATLATALVLLVVAIFVGMVDSESLVPRGVRTIWLGLIVELLNVWCNSESFVPFTLVMIPLGFPVVVVSSYVLGYVGWKTWRNARLKIGLRNPSSASPAIWEIRMLNVVSIVAFALVAWWI